MSEGAPDFRLVIPGAPKAWGRAGHHIVRSKTTGKMFVATYQKDEDRKEQVNIKWFASQEMRGRRLLEGPLELRMSAYMPIPASWSAKKQREAMEGKILPAGKPDLDNLTKQLGDAFNDVVYRDDAQIVSMHLWKYYSEKPRLCVEIRVCQKNQSRLGI
jgi:Holliday junction resolvase RusA-like endonuclease